MADSPLARRVAELVRQRALAAIFKHDQNLARVYERVAEGVRRDLRATEFTIDQVRKVIEKHFGATAPERQKIIEDAILEAAREARVLPQETFDAIYGKEAADASGRPLDQRSSPTSTRSLSLVRESEDEPSSTD